MKVTNAEFTISAVGPNQYPTDQKLKLLYLVVQMLGNLLLLIV